MMSSAIKTGILMLNMGGPAVASVPETQKFLTRLFLDRDIIQLPFQSFLGPWIAKRRAAKVAAKYQEIGGGSPILDWTRRQGDLLVQNLNKMRPESAPHKAYIGFRYADPLLEDTLKEIESDQPEHVVAFSQYPQYSCSTSGSSYNSLASLLGQSSSLNKIKWSAIDRWPLNRGLVAAFSDLVQQEVSKLPKQVVQEKKFVLLFSAHSLPLKVVARGDTYPSEVGATVHAVMESLKWKYPFRLVWQSKVGPLPWLAPATDDAIESLAKRGIKNFVLVPIAFVNEHIETLHELDIEYGHDLKTKLGIDTILRVQTPNVHPAFIDGITQLVADHLTSGDLCSAQLQTRCPKCINPACGVTRSWLRSLEERQSLSS